MNKLIVAFMLFYLVNVIVSGIMEGGGGTYTTHLTTSISAIDTTIDVSNTSGFLNSSYVIIGDEKIRHSSTTATTFEVAPFGRGWDNTEATSHPANAKAYSPEASVINSALGFNVASTGATIGVVNMAVAVSSFFFNTLPKLITWDFAHFRYSEWGETIRIVFSAISVGFMVYMAYNILSALGGVAQSIFTRP